MIRILSWLFALPIFLDFTSIIVQYCRAVKSLTHARAGPFVSRILSRFIGSHPESQKRLLTTTTPRRCVQQGGTAGPSITTSSTSCDSSTRRSLRASRRSAGRRWQASGTVGPVANYGSGSRKPGRLATSMRGDSSCTEREVIRIRIPQVSDGQET